MIGLLRYIELSKNYNEYVNLKEAFDNPLPYVLLKQESEFWVGQFEYEEYKFLVTFSKDRKILWKIMFAPVSSDGKELPKDFKWDVDLLNLKKASIIKVFSTIFQIVQEWIDKEKPLIFTFETNEAKREKLYDRFMNFLSFDKEDYIPTKELGSILDVNGLGDKWYLVNKEFLKNAIANKKKTKTPKLEFTKLDKFYIQEFIINEIIPRMNRPEDNLLEDKISDILKEISKKENNE